MRDNTETVIQSIIIGVLLLILLYTHSSRSDDFEPEYLKGTWFSYMDVYMGVDQTMGMSPQCHRKGRNDRLTSNMGATLNIFESYNRRFRTDLRYTHHSCMINPDRNGYDAIGINFVYRVNF